MKEVCKKEFECKGVCFLNVGGSYDAWDIVSRHCDGKKETEKLIDDSMESYFDNEKAIIENRIKLCDRLNITGKERDFIINENLLP